MKHDRLKLGALLTLAFVSGILAASNAKAACRLEFLPETGMGFRQNLQHHIRELGITGFGLTQPYRDSTISLFLASEVSLILREQDSLLIELGEEVPLPAEPLEIAKFNALAAFAASRFSGEDMPTLRARLLASVEQHQTVGDWTERSGEMVLDFTRMRDALLVKMHRQKCAGSN